MKNNIFEGAKFGDKFITENNKMFIYHHQHSDGKYHLLFPEYKMYAVRFKDDGSTTELGVLNIVSRYQEPIDEEKLEELANEYVEGGWNHMDMASRRDFKAGYRKAINR